jgi:hypothetical protein
MRLWHLVALVAAAAVVCTLARDPLSRIFLIVFVTGLGEVVLGLAAVMTLFQTVGALGEARGLADHAEALAATSVVLAIATALMGCWLFIGFWMVCTLT